MDFTIRNAWTNDMFRDSLQTFIKFEELQLIFLN